MIRLRGVAKIYRVGSYEVPALRGVDLEIADGEFLAIMGPSGSGKSTLMNLIGCLDTPSKGSYLLNGKQVSQMNDNELARIRNEEIGFVFQTFNLLPRATSLKNVELPLVYAGVSRRERETRAKAALAQVELTSRMSHRPSELSGGQRQRVAIARALVNDPALILADEPTANLDSKHGHEVMLLLRDVTRKQGRSVIVVSHDHRIREIADRVLWLEDGRFKALQALVRDPSCGMLVDPEQAPASHELDGQRLFFCSRGCRDEFLAQNTPQGYSGQEP